MGYTLIEDDVNQALDQAKGYTLIEDAKASPMDVPAGLASLMNIGNTMTMGFGDEIYGRLMPGDYKANRDAYRATVDKFRDEYPKSAILGDVSGALLPGGVAARVGLPTLAGLINPANPVTKAMTAAGVGAGYGAASGAGAAKEMEDVPKDTLVGAAKGAALGGATQLGGSALGAVYNATAPRVSQAAADVIARRRIAEALQRDETNVDRVLNRANKIGPEATIADAAGTNTRNLLDVVATMPGNTSNQVDRLIRQRQSGRAGRLTDAADESMGTLGLRYSGSRDALISEAESASKPFYDQLNGRTFSVSDTLKNILQRGDDALAEARKLAKVNGVQFPTGNPKDWQSVDFSTINTIKKSLYETAEATRNPATGKLSEYGVSLNKLRHELTGEVDNMTNGVYKQARDAFAGPSEMRSAMDLGMEAVKQDAWKIADITKNMSQSELAGFRIGAMEALRKQFGTQPGQTKLLNMWKEPATRDRLKELFPDLRSYREFASTVYAEGVMKGMERVGRGSQTASRQAGQDQLLGDTIADTVNLGTAIKSGNPLGVIGTLKDLYGRAATPEPVRNSIGSILLQRPSGGRTDLDMIRSILDMQQRRTNANVQGVGVFGGLL